MSEYLSVATANTYAGKLIEDSKGLEPFRRPGIDVLVLQEVLHLKPGFLEGRLESEGYTLANFDKESGLAIAVHQASSLTIDKDSKRLHSLREAGPVGQLARGLRLPAAHRLRTRAMVSVMLRTETGSDISVATTHPIVFARPLARKKQLRNLTGILLTDYAEADNLILAGDMNHYPRPSRADFALAEGARLKRAPIDKPTWPIHGSKHEWLARLASGLTGNPLDSYDGYLDSMLYRGPALTLMEAHVETIVSDHKAIIGFFELGRAAISWSDGDPAAY